MKNGGARHGSFKWTSHMDARLRGMVLRGVPLVLMAAQFHCGQTTVVNRCARLGLIRPRPTTTTAKRPATTRLPRRVVEAVAYYDALSERCRLLVNRADAALRDIIKERANAKAQTKERPAVKQQPAGASGVQGDRPPGTEPNNGLSRRRPRAHRSLRVAAKVDPEGR